MDITFAKKTTLDSLNSDISSYLSSTRYRIDVSKSVIDVHDTSWENIGTLPYGIQNGSVVSYNNEIHMFGDTPWSSNATKHYKWDGSTWVSVSTLPYNYAYGSAVVYNNEIHILGSDNNTSKHYTYASTYSIFYQLYTGMKIICNKSILTPISSNLSEITDGYKVTSTGLVQLQSSEPISETNRPLLTILS